MLARNAYHAGTTLHALKLLAANLSSSPAAGTIIQDAASSIPNDGLSLSHFINQARGKTSGEEHILIEKKKKNSLPSKTTASPFSFSSSPKVFIETYGCQMNVNDSEVVHAVLRGAGFIHAPSAEEADVVLVNTCAIRDNAESKIWQRLSYLKNLKVQRKLAERRKRIRTPSTGNGAVAVAEKATANHAKHGPVVGVLGCMAERLKHKLLESDKMVDLVAGPDAYRDLPRLLSIVSGGGGSSSGGAAAASPFLSKRSSSDKMVSTTALEKEKNEEEAVLSPFSSPINVQLSLDETYADVVPVRPAGALSVYLSIMRGCNNLCSFCVVPFTRGRERSRPVQSIIDEVRMLSDQGIKEITLLGQNVNSYADFSHHHHHHLHRQSSTPLKQHQSTTTTTTDSINPFEEYYARGFRSVYKPQRGGATSFAELLDSVAAINPEMRIRFTSPHPKDFSDDVLSVLQGRHNVCKQLHMPAQSGSTTVLTRMRRGYSREAYDALLTHVRSTLPGVSLSTDMISGFCLESEEEHLASVDLMRTVGYDQAFLFAYSERDKTHAARHYPDTVPDDVKVRRLQELITEYRRGLYAGAAAEVGRRHLVLVEGVSRKCEEALTGRTDTFKRVFFPDVQVPVRYHVHAGIPIDFEEEENNNNNNNNNRNTTMCRLQSGDYVAVQIVEGGGTLQAVPLGRTTLTEFVEIHGSAVPLDKF